MVKGVSQQVIEVSRTENAYFEKAILFLRSTASGMDDKELDDQAQKYLRGLRYRKRRLNGSAVMEILRFVVGMVLGGLLTWIAMGVGF